MKPLLLTLFLVFIVSFSGNLLAQTSEKYARVRIYANHDGLRRLHKMGLPVDHGSIKQGVFIETDLSDSEVESVRRAGFRYDIIHADVQAFYQERNNNTSSRDMVEINEENCSSVGNYPIPDGFELGSMAGFFTYEEMLQHLENMRTQYPDLISAALPIDGIETNEGRPIYWLRLSDNPNTDEQNEPEVLINAIHHAREPAGMSQLIFFMYYLLENYATDPEIRHLVNNTELYLVPCINPDGYIHNQTTNPNGGGMWRKNKRDNDQNGQFNSQSDGVDLNRNYGHFWGFDDEGSSPDPTSNVYRGDAAFSEPETQAMKVLCEQHQFQIALNYHTYSNLLIYPWGYIGSFETPDSAVFRNFSRVMTRENHYKHGTSDQTIGYLTNGDSDDWMYGEQTTKAKILSMTPEVGTFSDGFWPIEERIIPLCLENVWQNMHVLRFVQHYAETVVNPPLVINGLTHTLDIAVQRLGLKEGESFTISLEPVQNVGEVGAAQTVTGLELLETATTTLTYSLLTDLTLGDTVRWNLVVDNNEGLVTRQAFLQIYGTEVPILTDNCNNTNAWQINSSQWGLETLDFHSPPSCISDSPNGAIYDAGTFNELYRFGVIDLTGKKMPRLRFWAKWDIEAGYDYAQVLAYDNTAESLTPLCGKYTHLGGWNQAINEPLFEGTQSSWVQEDIDLSAFEGRQIQIVLRLVSDQGVELDGFYIDDIEMTTLDGEIIGIDPANDTPNSGSAVALPNPARENVRIHYTLPQNADSDAILCISDLSGKQMMRLPLNKAENTLNLPLSGLPVGTYLYHIEAGTWQSVPQKLVVLR